jgi:predicted nucleotidyltransferase
MLLFEISQKATDKYLDYHKTLCTEFWDGDVLKPEVRDALKRIANEFITTLLVQPEQIVDVILTGSLCNYNYTRYSDIDLHIILDYDIICDNCHSFDLDDCMKAKKSLWNERHDITVYERDVEVYVQDKTEHITGNAGIYSIDRNDWVRRPSKSEDVEYDDNMIMDKVKHIMYTIDSFVDTHSDDSEEIEKLKLKIKNMRKAGLERAGELSVENLAFKILRNAGYIERLHDYALKMKDESLSLE